MIQPPKKMRGGIPFITRGINGLREFILRTRVIPTNGFQETPSGVLPPPLASQDAGQQLQWVWSVIDGNFSFNKNGGFVYLPYAAAGNDQVPTFMQLPTVPMIGSVSVRVTDEEDVPPTIALTTNAKNYIVLTAELIAHEESIGDDNTPGTYQIKNNAQSITITGSTAEESSHTHTNDGTTGPADPSAHTHAYQDATGSGSAHSHSASGDGNALAVSGDYYTPLKEVNYTWDGTESKVTIAALTDVTTFESDDEHTKLRFLMGWVQTDEDDNVTDYLWCAGHAPLTLGRWGGHVFSDETGSSPRNPTPNSPAGEITDDATRPLP